MHSIVIYGRLRRTSSEGEVHPYRSCIVDDHTVLDIRTEVVMGNILDALDNAWPQGNEIVINTIPYPL